MSEKVRQTKTKKLSTEITSVDADWLNNRVPNAYADEDLHRIIVFYVFHTPCKRLSKNSIQIESYGWDNPWLKKNPRAMLFEFAKFDASRFVSANKLVDMQKKCAESNLSTDFFNNRLTQRVCFYNCESNEWISLFYHIRNALAHGRIAMFPNGDDITFVMEDGKSANKEGEGFYVSARMVLNKSTLLDWIDILEKGPKE